ncbi:hypothetical protein ACO2Q0_13110 [Phenylobacterium sp. VNQ135]|uniref:hypothetical protein n=1 Tax=Phenylobacterium sp. VNQ135 TaxID=3400922 RepID=UPI003C018EF8
MRKPEKAAALDKDLKAMFRALHGRALPDRIRCVVDQVFSEEQAEPAKKSA